MTYSLKPVKSDIIMQTEVLDFAKNNHYTITENDKEIQFTKANNSFKIIARKNTSDFHVFAEVFMYHEYQTLIEIYQQKYGNTPPKNIIDAGANIGCASIFFKNNFPNANIFAIEAEKSNFETLKQNIILNNFSNVAVFHNAFWINNDNLQLDDNFRDGREWAFAIRPFEDIEHQNQSSIKGITLQNIIDDYNIEQIDILKIDIEGGEKWILEDENTIKVIQKKVKMLLIEVHQDVILMETVLEIMQKNGFNFIQQDAIIFAFSS
ncbi:MAG: FkbM family methyltransferase [Cytophagales bacterium]|nr:MAG: FkbM family methyltransferase [Cytophagales bacterium]